MDIVSNPAGKGQPGDQQVWAAVLIHRGMFGIHCPEGSDQQCLFYTRFTVGDQTDPWTKIRTFQI